MPKENYVFDLMRIFFGTYPLIFYVEVLLRIVLMYVFTILALRVIAKKSAAQMTFVDTVLILVLGSATGDTMYYSEVPVIIGWAIITVVILLQNLLGQVIEKSERIHNMIVGQTVKVIEDGKLLSKNIEDSGFSENDILIKLRNQSIEFVEEIRVCYLESSGTISIFKKDGKFKKETSTLPDNLD